MMRRPEVALVVAYRVALAMAWRAAQAPWGAILPGMVWGQKERELPGRQLPRSGMRSIAAGALLCAGLGLDDSRSVYSGSVYQDVECVAGVQFLRFLAIR